jgi:large subunit ribosomal protein L3
MISGIIGKKLGMNQVFAPNGNAQALTLIEAGPCTVVQVKTPDKDGYGAVQLGFGEARRLNSPETGHLKGLGKFKSLREFRVADTGEAKPGDKVDVSLFKAGDRVNIIGVSKGKGFAGVVKRHHFHGGPKTHGQSDRHRAPGAIGSTTTPGRVLKGVRMAGHMGVTQVTAMNIEVVTADPERNLLMVRGAVPGARNGLVMITKVGGD